VTDASDVRHITPSVAYVIAAGAFTDLRLFELVAAVTEFGGEDIWQNAVVFVSAVSRRSHNHHHSPVLMIVLDAFSS
jgi:hypothetical protein